MLLVRRLILVESDFLFVLSVGINDNPVKDIEDDNDDANEFDEENISI
jgi:hypothetical protein